jgi:O-antigen ligase
MTRYESKRNAGSSEPVDARQIWLAGSATLMTAGLLASTSRAGILGGGIGLIVFLALSRRRTRGNGTLWIAAALGAMVVAAGAYGNMGALLMRMQSTTEQGDWGRAAIWRDTWRMVADFRWTGVGAGAFEHAMLVYQQGSRLFFFNHAHNEYLQILAEGGLLIAVPAAVALIAAAILIARHLDTERAPIFWVRAGAAAGLVAVCVQSVWDTGLRTPANGILFAVIAAIALHQPHQSREHVARHRRARGLRHADSGPAGDQRAPVSSRDPREEVF